MNSIIGYSVYGGEFFKSPSPPVRNVSKAQFRGSIVDEIHIKETTENSDPSFSKEDWTLATKLLATFKGDLEAGNIQNNGLVIEKFMIKRRRASELNSVVLGYKDFENETTMSFTDYSQPNDELVYSISPMSNDLEGEPNEVIVESDFVGWWLVDIETDNTLGFDTYIGGEPDVETVLTQGRTVIETLSKYPQVYYDEREYNSFTLTTAIIPSEYERSGKRIEDILNNFVRKHSAFIVKAGDGRMFICDVSNPRFSAPMNVWKQRDYGTVTLDFVEVQDYEEFMQDNQNRG
jgi:hypothetical protein